MRGRIDAAAAQHGPNDSKNRRREARRSTCGTLSPSGGSLVRRTKRNGREASLSRASGTIVRRPERASPVPFRSSRPMPLDAVNAAMKAQILAEALPYIQRFHDKVIVIKYGG